MNTASANASSAFGHYNTASGDFSSAFGHYNTASGEFSSAFGYQSQAMGGNSTALGYQAVASVAGAVSFGHSAADLDVYGTAYGSDLNARLMHVAAGIDATDAVNLGQMNAAIAGIDSYAGWNLSAGGGAAQLIGDGDAVDFQANDANGNLTVSRSGNTITYGFNSFTTQFGGAGGSFTILAGTTIDMGGNVVSGVANGVANTDAVNLGQLNAAVTGIPVWDLAPFAAASGGGATWAGGVFGAPTYTIQGVAYNNVGAALAAIDGWMTANAGGVQYDDPSHGTVTLDGAAGTQIKNVADGTDAMDAVNLGQMQAGDAATLTAANAYTDQRFAAWNDTFTQYQQQVDARFAHTDTRISRIGAMGTAMTQMAVNAVMSNSPRGRIAIGVGAQGGQGAVSIGYGRRIGDRGSFSLGASFASGESSVGGGLVSICKRRPAR